MSEEKCNLLSKKPVTRDQLKQLKTEEDKRILLEREKQRLRTVYRYVGILYDSVLSTAKTSSEGQCIFSCFSDCLKDYERSYPGFLLTNIQDIVKGLKELFPDTTIEFKNKNSIYINWS
jgi:hypothetical protein